MALSQTLDAEPLEAEMSNIGPVRMPFTWEHRGDPDVRFDPRPGFEQDYAVYKEAFGE